MRGLAKLHQTRLILFILITLSTTTSPFRLHIRRLPNSNNIMNDLCPACLVLQWKTVSDCDPFKHWHVILHLVCVPLGGLPKAIFMYLSKIFTEHYLVFDMPHNISVNYVWGNFKIVVCLICPVWHNWGLMRVNALKARQQTTGTSISVSKVIVGWSVHLQIKSGWLFLEKRFLYTKVRCS